MFPIARIFAALLLFGAFSLSGVAAPAGDVAVNPLRLSYINGQVSFWRYGAEDWVQARINTPMARGDALYVGKNSELELQAENRSFIRADDDTQLSIVDQTSDYLQVKVTSGRVSFDLRSMPAANYTIELDTPNAVFTIDRPGYYRVDIDGDVHFVTRRGGHATVIPSGGTTMSVQPSEEIVVHGTEVAQAETYAAPELDGWDRWNYERTNHLIDTLSERYLPPGIAGADDLDHYGNWRVVRDYGPVWVPDDVPVGWVPYSSGQWIWDPYYQWTWVDDAPWGWAPFHYGRWVFVDGYWMWAPGTVLIARPVYAPALVAFYGPPVGVGISVSIGSRLGWVALSWGEPVVPWWGSPGFIGTFWWGGWHGPRIINNTVINQTNITNITNITQINPANSRITNAVVTVPAGSFGKNPIHEVSLTREKPQNLVQVRGALPVQPDPVSLVAGAPKGIHPPDQVVSRPVVAVHRPPETKLPWRVEKPLAPAVSQPRLVQTQPAAGNDSRRPQFGTQTGPERLRPPLPPKYERQQRPVEAAAAAPAHAGPSPPEARAPRTDVRVAPAPNAAEPGNVRRDMGLQPPPARPEIEKPPMMRHEPSRQVPAPQSSRSFENQPPPMAPPHSERRFEPQPAPHSERRFEPQPAPMQPHMAPPQAEHPREQHVERLEQPRETLPGKPANQTFRKHGQQNKGENK